MNSVRRVWAWFCCGGLYVFALYSMIRFAITGEIWVQRGGWATLEQRPVAVATSLFANGVILIGGALLAYLGWTGKRISNRSFCALDQRRRLDNSRRQTLAGDEVT